MQAYDFTFWQYKVCADICGVTKESGVKRQWGCQQRQFSAFSLAISLETLQINPALLYGDTESLVGFSLIPKCAQVRVASETVTFENNCLRTNEDGPILSVAQIFSRDSNFWRCKVYVDIGGTSVERKRQTTVGSRVNAHLEFLSLAFENNA